MRFYALAERPWIEEDPGSASGAGGGGYWGLPPGTIGSVDLSAAGQHNRVFVTSDAPFAAGDVLVQFGTSGTRLDQLVLTGRQRNDWNSLLGLSLPNGLTLLEALWATLTVNADPTGLARAKPIIPTHKGVLNLHLGGHSLVRSEALPEDPTLHPAWPNIQAVLRSDYRGIYQRDQTLARKWLGAQRIKYRLSAEQVSELLIDDDLERLEPLEPTTTITDDFNRANQTGLGTSAEGWSWTGVTNNMDIVSNRASRGATAEAWVRAESDLSSDDHYAEGFGSMSATAHRIGTAVRFSSSADTSYYTEWRFTGDSPVLLQSRVAGTSTLLSNLGNASTGVGTLRLEADGSTLTVYLDGSPFGSPVTNTSITGNVRTGVYGRGSGSTIDDFEAADLVAGGADLVRVLSEAVGSAEARLRAMALARPRGVGVALTHTTARTRALTRIDAEALGIVEDSRFARALIRIRSHAVGIAEIVSDVVGALGDALVRVLSDTVGLAEARARFLSRTRARVETVGIGHATLRTRAISRMHSGALAIAETVVRLGGLVAAVVPAIVRNRRRTATRPATRLEAPPSPRMANRPARRT